MIFSLCYVSHCISKAGRNLTLACDWCIAIFMTELWRLSRIWYAPVYIQDFFDILKNCMGGLQSPTGHYSVLDLPPKVYLRSDYCLRLHQFNEVLTLDASICSHICVSLRSLECKSTIDKDDLTRYPSTSITGEENECVSNLVWITQFLER